MTSLAGADGCKGGWIVVCRPALDSFVVATIEELFTRVDDLAVLAIDIPIGLTDAGPRQCDVEARREIRPRGSSVFPAPVRAAIDATSYPEANRLSRAADGRGLSKQAFAIAPKIRAVDDALRLHPHLRDRVYEVHPELSFRTWRGAPMPHAKRTAAGRADRLELVAAHFGAEAFPRVRARHPPRDVADDDILDAFAALWTAERIANGTARTLPEQPPVDGWGLVMRIVC